LHNVSDTVRSYIIPLGAHHLDLLFTNTEADPPGVAFVRAEEKRHIKMWLQQLQK
jgi:lysosomal Pro-X carboxypeptidase